MPMFRIVVEEVVTKRFAHIIEARNRTDAVFMAEERFIVAGEDYRTGQECGDSADVEVCSNPEEVKE